MNKQKIMALLLSSLISVNQITSIANATTLYNTDGDDNNSTIISTTESLEEDLVEDNTSLDNSDESVSNEVDESENSEDINSGEDFIEEDIETPDETLENDANIDNTNSEINNSTSTPEENTEAEDTNPTPEENTEINDSDLVPYSAWENNQYLIDEVISKTEVSDINQVTYGDLKEIKALDLSFTYSGLPEIVSKFSSLVILDASGACIGLDDYSINKFFNIITQLTSLEELTISYNGLSTIPDSISELDNLKFLYANGNHFNCVPNSILSLPNLNYLELAGCNISEIPNNIDTLSNLIILELAENNLSSLPSSIGNMSSLRYIGLNYNEFYEFPNEVLTLKNLEDLAINNNHLIEIPDEISTIIGDKTVFSLDITNNQVYSLPELTTQKIICYNNFIEQYYAGFPYNAQLKLESNPLRLDVNEIISSERFKEFVYVYKLESASTGITESLDERIELDLIIDGKVVTPEDLSKFDEGVYTGKLKIRGSDLDNKASETSETFKILIGDVDYEEEEKPEINIPEDATGVIPFEYWENCTPLMTATYAALDGKNISEITFEDLATIDTLYLINQDLDDLPQLVTKYTNLKNLFIDSNKFREIPKEIFEIKNLEVLSLSGNGLNYISDKIGTLSNLSCLDLSYNTGIQDSLDNVFELTSLSELHLSGCNLYTISDKINNLKNLSYLGLYDNQLTSINGYADSIFNSGNLFYLENDFYKQMILKNTDVTLSKEDLTNKEYLNSLVEVKSINPYNDIDYSDELNPGHVLEFIVDGKVVSAEELSKYPDGTYEASLKIQSADISNTAAITADTVKVKIEGNTNTTLDSTNSTKPSTGTNNNNSNGSKPNKLPQTGNLGSLGLLFTGLLSLAGGSKLFNKNNTNK